MDDVLLVVAVVATTVVSERSTSALELVRSGVWWCGREGERV